MASESSRKGCRSRTSRRMNLGHDPFGVEISRGKTRVPQERQDVQYFRQPRLSCDPWHHPQPIHHGWGGRLRSLRVLFTSFRTWRVPVPNRQSNLLARIPTSNNEDRSNTVPVIAQIREVSPNVQSVQLSLVEETGSRHTHVVRSAMRTAPNVGTEGKQKVRPSLWNIPDINVERMNERNSEQGSCPMYLTRLSLPSNLHQFTTHTGGLGDQDSLKSPFRNVELSHRTQGTHRSRPQGIP